MSFLLLSLEMEAMLEGDNLYYEKKTHSWGFGIGQF